MTVDRERAYDIVIVVLFVVGMVILGLWVDTRTDALQTIQESAERIELAATNSEQVLAGLIEARNSPEQLAQSQRVAQALEEIAEIRALLCEIDDEVRAEACQRLSN